MIGTKLPAKQRLSKTTPMHHVAEGGAVDMELSFVDEQNSFILSPLQGYGHRSDFGAAMAVAAQNTIPDSVSRLSPQQTSASPAVSGKMSAPPPPLKEQSHLLEECKRENFSLRLKIYHMEERLKKAIPKHIEEAMDENMELRTRIDSLESELASTRQIQIESSRNLDVLSEEKRQLQSKLANIEQSFSSQMEDFEKNHEEEKTRLLRSRDVALKEAEHKRFVESAEYEEQLVRMQDECNGLKEKEMGMNREIFELKSRLERVNRDAMQTDSSLSESKQAYCSLQEELQREKQRASQLEVQMNAEKRRYESEIGNLKQQLCEIESEIVHQKSEREMFARKLEESETGYMQQISVLKRQFKESSALMNEQISSLQASLMSVTKEKKSILMEYEKIKGELEGKLSALLAEKNSNESGFSSELSKTMERLAVAEAALKTGAQEKAFLEESLRHIRTTTTTGTNHAITSLEQEVSRLRSIENRLENERVRLESSKAKVEEALRLKSVSESEMRGRLVEIEVQLKVQMDARTKYCQNEEKLRQRVVELESKLRREEETRDSGDSERLISLRLEKTLERESELKLKLIRMQEEFEQRIRVEETLRNKIMELELQTRGNSGHLDEGGKGAVVPFDQSRLEEMLSASLGRLGLDNGKGYLSRQDFHEREMLEHQLLFYKQSGAESLAYLKSQLEVVRGENIELLERLKTMDISNIEQLMNLARERAALISERDSVAAKLENLKKLLEEKDKSGEGGDFGAERMRLETLVMQRGEQLAELEMKLRTMHGRVAELERICEGQAATLKKRESLISRALLRLQKINKRREALSKQLALVRGSVGNRSFVSFTTRALKRL